MLCVNIPATHRLRSAMLSTTPCLCVLHTRSPAHYTHNITQPCGDNDSNPYIGNGGADHNRTEKSDLAAAVAIPAPVHHHHHRNHHNHNILTVVKCHVITLTSRRIQRFDQWRACMQRTTTLSRLHTSLAIKLFHIYIYIIIQYL